MKSPILTNTLVNPLVFTMPLVCTLLSQFRTCRCPFSRFGLRTTPSPFSAPPIMETGKEERNSREKRKTAPEKEKNPFRWFRSTLEEVVWEEPSMDPYQSQGKHLTNFQGHWSMQIFPESKAPRDWSMWISPEIHVDGSQISLKALVYTGVGR